MQVSKIKKIVMHRAVFTMMVAGLFMFLIVSENKNNISDIEVEVVLHTEITTERQTEPETAAEIEPETEPELEIEPETEPEIIIEDIEDITEDSEEPEIEEIEEEPKEIRVPVKVRRVYENKFDMLRARYNNNEDIIGIVKVPGTVIFYPVVHYAGDNNYYLDRNYYRQKSAAGSIFMDYENDVSRQDPNTILYGHQMSSNSMFHSIGYFRDENYFNAHRYVIFNTAYEDSVWEVFAFLEADISFNYIKVFFRSELEFLLLAREISRQSLYDTGIEIKSGDRILIMSTCTNINPDKRYVLASRLIKNKEDIPADILNQTDSAIEDFLRR
jgi:SrtB family sortase